MAPLGHRLQLGVVEPDSWITLAVNRVHAGLDREFLSQPGELNHFHRVAVRLHIGVFTADIALGACGHWIA